MSSYRRRTDPRTEQRYSQHRAVAEWHLGRPLRPGEIVHHVNERKEDDHLDKRARTARRGYADNGDEGP